MNIRNYKRTLLIAGGIAAVVTAVVIFGIHLNAYSSTPPQKYTDMYQSIVSHGKNVTTLTAQVQQIVAHVNQLDASHETVAAIAETTHAQAVNNTAKQQALALAVELKALVDNLDESAGFIEKQALFGPIDVEIDLVKAFVTYTQEMDSFLATLKQALASGSYEARKAVYGQMAEVNQQIDTINQLNAQFLKETNAVGG